MKSEGAGPAVSVVVPVYNEAGNAGPLFAEIREVMVALGRPFEVIFINDGSTDVTLEQLQAAGADDPCLRILDLADNYGEAAALCAGFRAARGDVVITLDGDGQNDPHDVPLLLDALERGGYRVVSGWRQTRKEGFMLRVLPSKLANAMIAAVTRIPVHDNGCGLKVYRREVVANAALPPGMNRFMPAIFGVTAEQVGELPVNDRRRLHGQSNYGIGRTLIVLRDLLALRCIITSPRRSEPVSAAVGTCAIAAGLYGLWHGALWLSLLAIVVALVAVAIWWNLRRFNSARRVGVYRLRREYSLAEGRNRRTAEGRSAIPLQQDLAGEQSSHP